MPNRGGNQKCRFYTVLAFGVVQIILGCLIIACGFYVIKRDSWVSKTYYGVWGGVWILLTGILGLIGGIVKSKGLVVCFMVLSIISCVTVWLGLLVIGVTGAIGDSFYTKQEVYTEYTPEKKEKCAEEALKILKDHDVQLVEGYVLCPNKPAAKANASIAFLAIVLLLVAILSSAFACCAVCKCCGAKGHSGDTVNVIYPRSSGREVEEPPPEPARPKPAQDNPYGQEKEMYGFPPDEVAFFRQTFNSMDKDGSGYVTIRELTDQMKKNGSEKNEGEIAHFFASIDKNGDGMIQFDEYLLLMSCLRCEVFSTSDFEELHRLREKYPQIEMNFFFRAMLSFKKADNSGDMKLSRSELKGLFIKGGAHHFSQEQIDGQFDELDKDGDGAISFEEFLGMVAGFEEKANQPGAVE